MLTQIASMKTHKKPRELIPPIKKKQVLFIEDFLGKLNIRRGGPELHYRGKINVDK